LIADTLSQAATDRTSRRQVSQQATCLQCGSPESLLPLNLLWELELGLPSTVSVAAALHRCKLSNSHRQTASMLTSKVGTRARGIIRGRVSGIMMCKETQTSRVLAFVYPSQHLPPCPPCDFPRRLECSNGVMPGVRSAAAQHVAHDGFLGSLVFSCSKQPHSQLLVLLPR
jgi:hypothetical protein